MNLVRSSSVGLVILACAACSSEPSNSFNPYLPGGGATGGTVGVGAAGGGGTTPGTAGSIGTAGSGGVVVGGGGGGTAGAAGGGTAGINGGGDGTGGVGTGGTGVAGSGGSMGGHGTPTPDGRGIYGHPDPNTQYPAHDGFTPWLIEEFNAPLDLDTDPNWTWSDGALGDGAARMVKDNISFTDGHMVIKATKQEQLGGYSFAAADNVATKGISTGELRTMYNNFRYGRYEVRMKAPPAASNYIFTMFAYRTPAYLNWREIDVEVQASPTNTFITNVISAKPGVRKWSGGIEESARNYPFGGDPSAGPVPGGFNTQSDFHVYAFEWTPTQIKWLVDDKIIRVKNGNSGANHLAIPELSTKIVMNLWIFPNGDLGGGDPNLNQYPIAGEYDWFRFYKWNADDKYPCVGTPACVSAEDLQLAKNNPNDGLPDIRPEKCTSMMGELDVACGP